MEGFRNEAHKNAFTHPVLEYIADTDADMQRKMEYMANAIAENAEL